MDDEDSATAAEQLILRWNSSPPSVQSRRLLFDGGDRSEADSYLLAVDEILQSANNDAHHVDPRFLYLIQIVMARLEDEFRNILETRVNAVEIESLSADLSFTSLTSADFSEDSAEVEEGEEISDGELIRRSNSSNPYGNSIKEINLLPDQAIEDLRSIAKRLVEAGHFKEIFHVHRSLRKSALDRNLCSLGVENISIGDVQKLDWETLETKIRQWIRATKVCIRVIFPSERRLWDLIFETILPLEEHETHFLEIVKSAILRLLNFADAISISRRTPEKLFKILDLRDALSELLPDMAQVFHAQVREIIRRLSEAARGILSEFESAVRRDPSKIPLRGGAVHPLTRYVMNYLTLIMDYKKSLLDIADLSDCLPRVIAHLQDNLESKAELYKDEALYHFFLMNNLHYIVQKARGNEELREILGDDDLRRLTAKYQKSATEYRRSSWGRVLQWLKDEGLKVGGSFSKSALRDRFRSFNGAFEEVHKSQSLWFAPDEQLREELRISVAELLIPAYRGFVGRFGHHIESGRNPEAFIKYSVEDLEAAVQDFFQGTARSLNNRRRSQS